MKDTKQKSTGKFNFFDILVIVLIAAVILAAAFVIVRRYSNNLEEHDQISMRYTVAVRGLPEEMNIQIENGEEVTNTVLIRKIGNVVGCEVVPAEYDEMNLETKTLVHGHYDDLRDVYITIETDEVDKTEREYVVGGTSIAIGSYVYFRTPRFLGAGYITDIEELPSEE